MKYLAIIPLIIMSSFMVLHHFYIVPIMNASEEAEEAEVREFLRGPFQKQLKNYAPTFFSAVMLKFILMRIAVISYLLIRIRIR